MNTHPSIILRLTTAALLLVMLFSAPGGAAASGMQAAGDDAWLSEKSIDPVVGVGQNFQIFFTFLNTGSTTWQPGSYWLQNLALPMGAAVVQPLSGPVIPGGLSTWSIRLKSPMAYGVYRTVWRIYHSGVAFGTTVFVDVKVAPGWVGAAVISADTSVVALGIPEIGTQFMAYDSYAAGSQKVFVPMLFRNAWGNYNAALYVQNVDPDGAADVTIQYYDSNGTLTCSRIDSIPALASKGYWMPAECVFQGWVGGAVITANRDIIALGRPHIGTQITSYNGFAQGSMNMYVPMLFKWAWGNYNAALYIQNTDEFEAANITIEYRDLEGNLTCTHEDTMPPRAAVGYWMPSECVPTGWVGGAIITADREIVAVGRPHIGTQITAYNGFAAGSTNSYVPVLFKATADGKQSAFYVQNVDSGTQAEITLDFYDRDGNLTCYMTDNIPPYASHGYWLAGLPEDCLPEDWSGSVRVSSSTDVVAMGRPHYGTEIFAYDGFGAGSLNQFLPMLFRVAFDGTYNASFALHNTNEANVANVRMDYYDSVGTLVCTVEQTVDPQATLHIEVRQVDLPCP